MENNVVTESNVVLEKKIESYKWDDKNFIAPQEITVTITISEYRDLVSKVACSETDISSANAKRVKAEGELLEIKKENEELRAEICTLRRRLEHITVEEDLT